MGSLFLASKIEENMISPRKALSVFYHILQPSEPALEVNRIVIDQFMKRF